MEDASPDESCMCGIDREVSASRSEVDSGIVRPSDVEKSPDLAMEEGQEENRWRNGVVVDR